MKNLALKDRYTPSLKKWNDESIYDYGDVAKNKFTRK